MEKKLERKPEFICKIMFVKRLSMSFYVSKCKSCTIVEEIHRQKNVTHLVTKCDACPNASLRSQTNYSLKLSLSRQFDLINAFMTKLITAAGASLY